MILSSSVKTSSASFAFISNFLLNLTGITILPRLSILHRSPALFIKLTLLYFLNSADKTLINPSLGE